MSSPKGRLIRSDSSPKIIPFVKLLEKKHLVLFFSGMLPAAVIYSPYMLSVSMWAFCVLSIISFKIGRRQFSLQFDKDAFKRLFRIAQYPSLVVVTLFFFVVFIGFWDIQDVDYWLARIRIKIPFLLLPIAFIMLPRFTKSQIDGLFFFLLILLFVSAAGIGINYLLNFEEINVLMKKGHPMPTPRNHIRFSLLMAFGIIGGAYLYLKKHRWRYSLERPLILVMTILLFFFIHLLSVRSGMLALYAAIGTLAFRYVFLSKKYLQGAAVLLVLAATPLLAYYLIPSFKSKIDYTRYDLLMYRQGKGADYADSGRIISLKAGLEIAKRKPLFGVGAANLKREVANLFREKYPQFKNPLMPHNQFVFVLAGTGIAGLLIFVFAFGFPLFYRQNYRNVLLLAFYAIMFVAFILEHSIENSLGVGEYSFFLLLLLNHLNGKEG